MSARDRILANLRRAVPTGRREPEISGSASNPLPAALREVFSERARSVGARVHEAATPAQCVSILADIAASLQQPARGCRSAHVLLERLPWENLAQRGIVAPIVREGADPEDSYGLTIASAGIAETGTIVVASGNNQGATLCFLPPVHIAVLPGDALYPTQEVFFERATEPLPRHLCLVTGPSRSADIGQKLILGAHGPVALHIIVFTGSRDSPAGTEPVADTL